MKTEQIARYFVAYAELQILIGKMDRREPVVCFNFGDTQSQSLKDIMSEMFISASYLVDWYKKWDKKIIPIINYLWNKGFHYEETEHILYVPGKDRAVVKYLSKYVPDVKIIGEREKKCKYFITKDWVHVSQSAE
ncbi:MAG: hypothetical protein WC976_06495 [Caldisericia bacterium]